MKVILYSIQLIGLYGTKCYKSSAFHVPCCLLIYIKKYLYVFVKQCLKSSLNGLKHVDKRLINTKFSPRSPHHSWMQFLPQIFFTYLPTPRHRLRSTILLNINRFKITRSNTNFMINHFNKNNE